MTRIGIDVNGVLRDTTLKFEQLYQKYLIDAEEDFSELINRATTGSYTTDANNYDYTEDELDLLNSVFGGIPIDEESAKDIDFLQSLQDKYGTDVNFEVTRRLPQTR